MLKKVGFVFLSFLLIGVTLTIITLTSCSGETIVDPPHKNKQIQLSKTDSQILNSSSSFGLKIFGAINSNEEYKNIFISPLSLSLAFGMALNGAEGKTYEEMVKTLELNGLTLDEINKSNKYLKQILTTIDPKVKFEIANSIWNRKGFAVLPSFLEINKNFYDAETRELDFANPSSVDVINKWVANKTYNKIDKILDEINPSVVMYLINALYFKADWKYKFEEKNTIKGEFQTHPGTKKASLMIDKMTMENKFNYYEDDFVQAVDFPYGDSLFSMLVLLPSDENSISAIDDLIKQLDVNYLNKITKNVKYKKGFVHLPKFKFTYFKELVPILQSLGMVKATNAEAEFTKITPGGGIFISRVLHKTFVEVNEKGTEAAAVTAIEFEKTSVGDNFNMNVNRPFLFLIRENTTNTILFAGKLVDPTLEN